MADRTTTTTTNTSITDENDSTTPTWIKESITGGSLKRVDLTTGTNGWASPPGSLFNLRSKTYFTKKLKSPAPDPYLLSPVGVDWLKSTSNSKLDNVLSRSDNRIMTALRADPTASPKSFIFAVNLQVPGRDHYSAVFYFASEEAIDKDKESLLYRSVKGDNAFRNSRFKIVNRIVKGPWIVKAAVGNYSACLLGKALRIDYHRGENYLELDVDIGSSAIASAILHLALGYVTHVAIDMGFVIEAQNEEELPERLIGAVRVCQMEMSSATLVEAQSTTPAAAAASSAVVVKRGGLGPAKVENNEDEG